MNESQKKINEDKKYRSWGMPELKLSFYGSHSRNIDLFYNILQKYQERTKPESSVLVFKAVELVDAIQPICELPEFSDEIKLISILRDCRGTFNSQRKTKFNNKPFNRNPLITAYQWNYHVGKSLDYSVKGKLKIIKFEDLISNQEEIVDSILNYIEPEKNFHIDKSRGDLFSRLPSNQKPLHPNIHLAPQPEKINEWQNELSKFQIAQIERSSRNMLTKLGYPLSNVRLNLLIQGLYSLFFKLRILLKLDKYHISKS